MSWEFIKLGSICKTGAGGTPLKRKKEYYENGNIPWLRSGEVNNRNITKCEIKITEEGLNNSSAKLFPKGTVLIAMYGATAGEVGILNFECSTNQAVCGILPNQKLLPEFLYYFFLDFKNELVAQAVGNAQPNISQTKIKNTLVPLISKEKQKQIVAILDQAFAAIDQAKANIEKNIENAKELFQSKLNEIFSQKGEGWEEKRLSDIVSEVITKGATPTTYGFPFVEEGIVFLRSECVSDNGFNPKGIRYISDGANEKMRRSIIKPGDILISITGNIGRVVRYPANMSNGNINQHIARVRVTDESILSDFIVYQIQSEVIQKHYQSVYNGTAYPLLSLKQIRETVVNIPNIDKQTRIVSHIDALKKSTLQLISQYYTKSNDLEELKKSILQKAFAGELTSSDLERDMPMAAEPAQEYKKS